MLHRHLDNLSDDYRYWLQWHFYIDTPMQDQMKSLTLYELDSFLHRAGKTLTDYRLPSPTVHFDQLNGLPHIIAKEKKYNLIELNAKWQQGYIQANIQQREILDAITSTIELNCTTLFFIDGPGGTGKTYIEKLLLAWVLLTASLSPSLLLGLHLFFSIEVAHHIQNSKFQLIFMLTVSVISLLKAIWLLC